MKNLQDFIGPVQTPVMDIRVIDHKGEVTKTFSAPEGFQLERYVDSIYPDADFMTTVIANKEVTISVLGAIDIVEIYQGTWRD